jgi:catechol 2,3-dioxygenase-like lactoylglutathione lyase family enzyme
MNEAMKYNGVLIAVSDMENSRRFYSDVLGLSHDAQSARHGG